MKFATCSTSTNNLIHLIIGIVQPLRLEETVFGASQQILLK